MVKIKICGITNLSDALAAADFGADAIGFNFYERSLRYISPRNAKKIIDKLPSFIHTVGVFVDDTPKEINTICDYAGITIAQLHDDAFTIQETLKVVPRVMKTFRVHSKFDAREAERFYRKTGVNTMLFETRHEKMLGGTRKEIIPDVTRRVVREVGADIFSIVSGGLNEKNVQSVIESVKPYGIDIVTGIESDIGKKNHRAMKRFIEKAKSVKS
jgi:phosphoribosylanthranilate isomerase